MTASPDIIKLVKDSCRVQRHEIAKDIWFQISEWSRDDIAIQDGLAPSGAWMHVGSIEIKLVNGQLVAVATIKSVDLVFWNSIKPRMGSLTNRNYNEFVFDCADPQFPGNLIAVAQRAVLNHRKVHNLRNKRVWRKHRILAKKEAATDKV